MTAAAMTPGTYLKRRRLAAGLSLADVAEAIATEPHVAAYHRAYWLSLIEADVQPATFRTIAVLLQKYPFDTDVLARLNLIRLGAELEPPLICATCAGPQCSQTMPPDHWLRHDSCSDCLDLIAIGRGPRMAS